MWYDRSAMRKTSFRKIQEVANKIALEYKPEKIILFGSHAWGKPHPDSDADLLVVKETRQSTFRVAQEIDASIFPRDFAMDFIVYTPSRLMKRFRLGDPFIKKILTEGITLYEKEIR